MADQTALSLYELIGAPLHALINAERQAAQATSEFIREVGFEGSTNGSDEDYGELRMLTFTFSRPDPSRGENQQYEVQVPLLSLLPIPALQIKDAELEYYAKILDTPRQIVDPSKQLVDRGTMLRKTPTSREASSKMLAQLESQESREAESLADREDTAGEREEILDDDQFPALGRIDLKATIGQVRPDAALSSRRSSIEMEMRIKIRMEQADIPAGLSRLFNMMEQNITSTRKPPDPSPQQSNEENE